MTKGQRSITWRPAFHRCHPDPSKNYGIGDLRMTWTLNGGDGYAVSWDVNTGITLPPDEFKAQCPACPHPMHQDGAPSANFGHGVVDLHSPVPRWEGHEQTVEACVVTGQRCYGDVGYSLADEGVRLLPTEGEEAVWEWLEGLLADLHERSAVSDD